MTLKVRVPVTAGLLALLLLPATGCARLRAADQLNKGVAAFKNAKYEEATDHFQRAVAIDPNYDMAKLYLATTYSSQVVQNLDTPENNAMAQKAIDGFQEVLSRDPNDLTALRQIAAIKRITGHIDEAKKYELRVISVDPNDPDAYYALGGIDYKIAADNALAVLKSQGIATDDTKGNAKLTPPNCAKLSQENSADIQEGFGYLQKAVAINPTYDEALTYLSLMERRKADIECGNDAARRADIDQAMAFEKQSMGARAVNEKRKEAKSHGVAM